MAAILRWMFVLVLLIAVAGGGAGYWLYSRSDDALRLVVLQQLKALAPTLKFDLARSHLDMMGRVRIYGMTVALPDDELDQPSLEIQEVIATLESTQLADFENVVIQKLHIVHPKMRVTRRSDGVWNWQQVAFQPQANAPPPPDIEIEHGTIVTEFQMPDKPSRKLRFQNFNVSAHPADSRRLSIQVATLLEPTGPLMLQVDAAMDGSTWNVSSRTPWRVPVDQGFIQLLCDLSPDFVAKEVTLVGQQLDAFKAKQAAVANGPPPADPIRMRSRVQTTNRVPDFGFSCDCDLTFNFKKEESGGPVNFSTLMDISKGDINSSLLAFPLNEVAGQIYVDNREIVVKDLRGNSGPTQVSFNSKILPSTPITATIKVRGVEINDELKARLPEQLRKLVQSLGLTGICDVDASVTQDGGTWQPYVDLRLSKGTVTHDRFPVTVREVSGKLLLEKNVARFKAAGKYAGQLVEAYGTVTNPGPTNQADIVVKSNNLPLDDESLTACPTPVRKSIEALKLRGRHDVLLRVTRQAGDQQKYEPELNSRLYDASLCFVNFPFAVQKLQGYVRWKGDLVEFKDLKGVHDGATLTGLGTFQRMPGPGRLELTVNTTDASFDRSLEIALPPTLRQVWNNFQPQGNFDAQTKIAWVPGSPCEVILPSVTVRDGEILMKCFPWSLQRLKGEFSYNTEPGKLVMKEIHAQHDDTLLSGSGIGWFPNQKPWQLKFAQLDVDSLIPNATFRNALPVGLQKVFDFLRPTGVFSFHGPAEFAELRQGDNSIGAAWKLRTVLSGCAINAGRRIDEIYGVVQLNGEWDGNNATVDGDLDLDSLSVFRQPSGRAYHINGVRGPISFRDNKFVAGTETAIPPRKSDKPDSSNRIRGQAIGGAVFLDAVVNLGSEPQYKAFVELKDGQLESYAQQYLRGRSNLAGIMNGWMNLRGKGSDVEQMTGEGKLIIDKAALYDSPLFAQMFRILKLQAPEKTAFENAAANFTVANSRFDLNSIELLGDTLSMRGRGYVRFDGAMQMDFGVRLRQWLPNNLTAVEVSGTVNDPKTRTVTFPELDGALRQFLKAFNPGPMTPRPGLFDSLTGQNGDAMNR